MSTFIGQMGRLVELPYVGALEVQQEERYSLQTTAEGRVVGQTRAARGRRSWALSVKHYRPHEQAALMAFANGEWGPGPFVFVPVDAPVTNMLSPDAASCAPGAFTAGSGTSVSEGGPLLTPDGWAGRSYSNNGAGTIFHGTEKTPVIPGQKVTASTYVLGAGARGRIAWYDAAGDGLGSDSSAITASAGGVIRSWLTATAPDGAASAYVCSVDAVAAAHPAITWTGTLLAFADGQGCPKAVLQGASRSVVKALSDPRTGRWSDISFTVQEVG